MPHAIKAKQKCPVLSSIWDCPPGRLRGKWRWRQPVERIRHRNQFQSSGIWAPTHCCRTNSCHLSNS